MSGICGILRFDSAPPEGIEAMTAHMQSRGPDGAQHFRNGACALGHTLLATTPEALHETMPLTHAGTGCTITADVRLDNRDELLPALGLTNADRIIGDGEIILHAYLKWGEECPKHLLGDFAFAIWDPRTQRIFAARDHMGMKQLIHSHVEGKLWAFASEPQAVLLAQGVPRQINEGRIADFLENYLECIDYTETFFEQVFRLPPAHCLTVDATGLTLRRYWELTPGPELKLSSDEAYAQAFLEVFTQAVQCRLRSNGPVGSMLSGGMDSGSVVAVASWLLGKAGTGPLHTFSAVGPDAETCIETRTARASQTMPGLAPQEVNHAELEPWADDLIRLTKASAEPFDAHMVLPRAMYLAAQRSGVRVMLDGVTGDTVLTDGSQLARLLRRGRLWQAWREARGLENFFGVGRGFGVMIGGLREAIVPDWLRRVRAKWQARRDHLPKGPLLGPEFAQRVDLADRVARDRACAPIGMADQATQRIRGITGTRMIPGRERYDRVAASCGIEPRDPFMDIRLVQFCLSLPPEQAMRDGWRKMILRRAMSGLLPDTVRWRKGKEHLGGHFILSVWKHAGVEPARPAALPVNLFCVSAREAAVNTGHRQRESLILEDNLEVLSLLDWLNCMRSDLGVDLNV